MFAGTTHRGTVVDIDSDSNTGEPIYGVRYDDGDTADYTLAELSEKLVQSLLLFMCPTARRAS